MYISYTVKVKEIKHEIYLLKLTESHGVYIYTRVCIYYNHVVVFTYNMRQAQSV